MDTLDKKLEERRKKAEYMRKWNRELPPGKKAEIIEKRKLYDQRNPDRMKNWRVQNNKHIKEYATQKRMLQKQSFDGRFEILRKNGQSADKREGRLTDNIITVEEISQLFDNQEGKCAYTNVDLSINPGPYFISLDRVNSTLSHTFENCKLVTLPINLLKGNMTYEEFQQLLNNIRENTGVEYVPPDYDTFPSKTKEKLHMLMADIKRRAKKANQICEIDLAKFKEWRITKGDICALTGCSVTWEPKKWNTGSIDRIDSSLGYTMDNIQIVLWPINMMKNDMSDDDAKVVIDYIL